MDLACFWREKIEGLLIQASWVSQVRQELALEGMSPVWSDLPAWYFWHREYAGAFQLGLEESFSDYAAGQNIWSGIFSIKFFPAPTNPLLKCFSPEEQEFVLSEAFDSSCTPCFEAQDSIPGGLFNIASLECTVDEEQSWFLLSLDSADILRTISLLPPGGDVLRQVPGWQLGYALFEPLVSLHSFVVRKPPDRVTMLTSPGFECQLKPDHSVIHEPVQELIRNNLLILYNLKENGHSNRSESYVETFIEAHQGHVTLDMGSTCQERHNVRFIEDKLDWCSPRWWTLCQMEFQSNLASTCGCSHDHSCEPRGGKSDENR